jgi:FkbM family methyltransferase
VRAELIWSPRLLCERIADASRRGRRLSRLRGSVAGHLQAGHIESLELLELLRPIALDTIHDIGANVGSWTLLAKAIHPRAHVEAFEPLDEHAETFERRTSKLSGVRLHRVALGSHDGEADMNVADFSDASSLLPLAEESYGLRAVRQERVAVRRLDDLVGSGEVPPPDLIKLDVQGYELEVLRGARDTLDRARAVIAEVSFVELYQYQCFFHEIVSFMADRRFRLHALGTGTAVGAPLVQTDVLFLKTPPSAAPHPPSPRHLAVDGA